MTNTHSFNVTRTDEIQLTCSDEKLQGIKQMAFSLFGLGDIHNHLKVIGDNKDEFMSYGNSPHFIGPVYNNVTSKSICGGRNLCNHNLDLSDWANVCHSACHHGGKQISMKYTCLFPIHDFFLLMQYNSDEFLEGAKLTCQWFGVNPDEHITHIHTM